MFSGKGRFQNSEEMKEYEGGKWTVIQENSNLKNSGLKNAGLKSSERGEMGFDMRSL